MCRCAVCAVSDAECLAGCILHISHVIPLRVFQLLKSKRWNSAVFGVLQSLVARELRAELVNVGTVAGRRLRAAGRSPRLCLCAWVLHPIRRRCTRSDRVQRPVTGAEPGVGVAARTMVGLVTPKHCAISGSNALVEGAMH